MKSTDHSMGPGWMGTFVIDKMLEQCKALDIPVLTEHRATHLLVDEDGTFRAVEAQTPRRNGDSPGSVLPDRLRRLCRNES